MAFWLSLFVVVMTSFVYGEFLSATRYDSWNITMPVMLNLSCRATVAASHVIDRRLHYSVQPRVLIGSRNFHTDCTRVVSMLLLLAGIELNPGPAPIVNNVKFNGASNVTKLGLLNVRSAVHKASLEGT